MEEAAAGKLNPIQRIAKELEPHSSLSEDDIERSLVGIIEVLQMRAEDEIEDDPESDEASVAAMEFLAFTEMVTMFGSSLLAYDEIEKGSPPEKEMKN